MTELAPRAAVEPLCAGQYALSEVELGSGGAAPEPPFELSLALPFGALFSALFHATPFRVRSLALEYVSPERLGPSATFSAKVTDLAEGPRAVRLSLLVFRESRVCVRGSASIEILGQHRDLGPASRSSGVMGHG